MKDESSRSKVLLEISILEKCKHPNIVRLYEIFESEKHMLYVSELWVGGDLLTYVRKRRRLKESLAKYLFLQIIDGLRYMHSKGIVHRDVKLDNILLDETGKLKICDFGVSRFTKTGQIMTEQCGTPAYIAPEILKGRGYSGFGVDVWSAGVVLYAMLYGSVPFKGNGIQEMHPYILAGQYTLGNEASDTAKDLIRKILTVDHEARITIDQILEHEWMQNIVPKNNIFNEEEMEEIDNEFNISKAKNIYNLYKMNTFNTEMHDIPFTEGNLDSTQNMLAKNITTKSVVLAPFNSTMSNVWLFDGENKPHVYPSKNNLFKFKGRVKELDREYEKNNNGELDNGVYNRNTESLLESLNESIMVTITLLFHRKLTTVEAWGILTVVMKIT
jgi:protein-serine/threonine kinase